MWSVSEMFAIAWKGVLRWPGILVRVMWTHKTYFTTTPEDCSNITSKWSADTIHLRRSNGPLLMKNDFKQNRKSAANLTNVHGQLMLCTANLFTQGAVIGRLLLFCFLKRHNTRKIKFSAQSATASCFWCQHLCLKSQNNESAESTGSRACLGRSLGKSQACLPCFLRGQMGKIIASTTLHRDED